MIKPAYYNEIDEYAAQWIRNLIAAGHIAPGDVDTRSIEDVRPDDLRGYGQCHFFAGVGVWSYALRRAGVPDDANVWTGSCPCQPFSAAGQRAGVDDKRHLWPHFHWLISQCRPAKIVGEQVASRDADAWIDLVQADMEAMGYTFGANAFPAASIGAPNIRDRLYWVADAAGSGLQRCEQSRQRTDAQRATSFRGRAAGRMADADGGNAGAERQQCGGEQRQQPQDGVAGVGLGDSDKWRREGARLSTGQGIGGDQSSPVRDGETGQRVGNTSTGCREGVDVALAAAGPVHGFWRDADWLYCRDDKWRPVEPGTFPLAHGAPARVGRLRAYGNAINAEQATLWCELTVAANLNYHSDHEETPTL